MIYIRVLNFTPHIYFSLCRKKKESILLKAKLGASGTLAVSASVLRLSRHVAN